MSNSHPAYGPPLLREGLLRAKLLEWYPAHKSSVSLLSDLIEEYKRFWRLILNYPHRRVVAPGPVMAVQRVHQSFGSMYFDDCMAYFRAFMRPDELAWRGYTDYRGTVDTIMVYQDMFTTDPPQVWSDMTAFSGIKRNSVRLLR